MSTPTRLVIRWRMSRGPRIEYADDLGRVYFYNLVTQESPRSVASMASGSMGQCLCSNRPCPV